MTGQQKHAYTGVAGRRWVIRRAVLGGAAGALGLLAAACEPGLQGATPPPASQTKEPVTLTWWGPGHWRGVTGKETDPSATLMDWYAAKAAEFSQLQPHVTFNLEAMASGTERRQKLEL